MSRMRRDAGTQLVRSATFAYGEGKRYGCYEFLLRSSPEYSLGDVGDEFAVLRT